MVDTLISILDQHVEQQPNRRALAFVDDKGRESHGETFAEVQRGAQEVAGSLRVRNLFQQPVILLYPTGPDFVHAFLGCMYSGAVAVPSPLPTGRKYYLERVRHMLRDCGAALVLVEEQWKDRISEYLASEGVRGVEVATLGELRMEGAELWRDPAISAGDLTLLQYSSGSTGAPKGVMVDHANLVENSAVLQARWGGHRDSVYGSWLPLFHDMGLIGTLLQVFYLGCSGVFMAPITFVKRPHLWLRMISDYRVDIAGAPNFGYEHCLRQVRDDQIAGIDLSSWRVAFNGAEPVRAKTLARFSQRFQPFGFNPAAQTPSYGLAEATLCVACHDRDSIHRVLEVDAEALNRHQRVVPAPNGHPLVACGAVHNAPRPAPEVRIVDPDTLEALPEARVGEIWVSGASVARGYWGREADSDATFRARIAAEGETEYLRTGDLGFVLQGEFYITGRLKDLIVFNGRNISPEDIERVAEEDSGMVDALGDAVAFAVDDSDQEVVVIIQELATNDLGAEALSQAARTIRTRVLSDIQVDVARLLFVPHRTLPRTTSGKKQRRQAGELFREQGLPRPVHEEDFSAPAMGRVQEVQG